MEKINIILEKESGELWGRIVDEDQEFSLFTSGSTTEEVVANLKILVTDYLENEGLENPRWKGKTVDDIEFNLEYDLTAFFDLFDSLKISSLADQAGINQSLMRQYASGIKHPSSKQVKKIQGVVHELAQSLLSIQLA